eukprot:COSAG04_NODE_290_length_17835_cov_11.494982_9_plen_67_part_00
MCKTLGLDVDEGAAMAIDEEAFAAACRAQPNDVRERRPVEKWFAELQLKLVEERSCLDDVLATCGC